MRIGERVGQRHVGKKDAQHRARQLRERGHATPVDVDPLRRVTADRPREVEVDSPAADGGVPDIAESELSPTP